jgi:hypothetical protein
MGVRAEGAELPVFVINDGKAVRADQ